MKLISSGELQRALSFETLIPALRDAFYKDNGESQKQSYSLPEGSNTFSILTAWTDQILGTKSYTQYPNNPKVGHPAISSQILLFSRETGAPIATVDGTSLTYWCTAAMSAIASGFMSRQDASSLLLFGSGELSSYMALAHAFVRPVKTVYISSYSEEKALSIKTQILASRSDLAVELCPDPDSIITQVDIISCATNSLTPLFKSALLAAGTHIDLVGNRSTQGRECNTATIKMSHLMVDSRQNAFSEAGEILIPLKEGAISESHIKGELAELCRGDVAGRTNNSQITLFKSVHSVLAEITCAYLAYQSLTQA